MENDSPSGTERSDPGTNSLKRPLHIFWPISSIATPFSRHQKAEDVYDLVYAKYVWKSESRKMFILNCKALDLVFV